MMRAAETPSRRAGTHIRTDAQLQSRRALACRLCLLCRVCVWLVRAVVVLFAGARSPVMCVGVGVLPRSVLLHNCTM